MGKVSAHDFRSDVRWFESLMRTRPWGSSRTYDEPKKCLRRRLVLRVLISAFGGRVVSSEKRLPSTLATFRSVDEYEIGYEYRNFEFQTRHVPRVVAPPCC